MTVRRWDGTAILKVAATVLLGVATAPMFAFGADSRTEPRSGDAATTARDVFQGQDFWWKRVEHRRESSSWLQSILQSVIDLAWRAIERIADWLARLLRNLFGALGGSGSSSASVVIWLILLALLAWSAWKLVPMVLHWLHLRVPTTESKPGLNWETLPEASDLFEQSRIALREAAYAEAIRLALLALIARLEKQGLLRYNTASTNREYQRELRDNQDLARRFGQVSRIYERVWYGRMLAAQVDAEQAIRICGAVIDGEELEAE